MVCTQPRRISAISVAERIAAERGEPVGAGVGYSIRLEKKGGPGSSVVMCTNGVLLRQIVQKGDLGGPSVGGVGLVEGATHIVVDEIHERDRFADFLLIILKDVLPRNPQVKVILMSATLQIDLFAGYFDGCPVISVPGFTYPVEQFYLEDVLGFVGRGRARRPRPVAEAPPELEAAMMTAFMAGTDEAFDDLLEAAGLAEGDVGAAPLVNAAHAATGATALMVAAGKGRIDVVNALLMNSADPGLSSADGSKAKDWAVKFGHQDIAETLIFQEEEARKGSHQQEAQVALSQYQVTVNADEVDLDPIVQLVAFICLESTLELDYIGAGAILVFLPGWDEIIRLKNALEARHPFSDARQYSVLPLHSMVPVAEQRKVFVRPPEGVRKIVLATNIAETAITIDDIVFVINSGRHKEKSYDPYTGVSTLQSTWTSKASEKQRKGRAGRCQAGVCFHIYSTGRSDSLAEFQVPELKRTPLEEVCLQIKSMEHNGMPIGAAGGGPSVAAFLGRAIEPPVDQAVENALGLLEDIGALEQPGERLTLLGKHLASLPLPPQIGKLLLHAVIFGCLDSVLTAACSSAYRDPWVIPIEGGARKDADRARHGFAARAGGGSDHLATVAAFDGWRAANQQGWGWKYCNQNFVSQGTMRMIDGMRDQLIRELKNGRVVASLEGASTACHHPGVVRAVLGCGMYPQIGYLKRLPAEQLQGSEMKPTLMTKRGEKVRVHPKSVNSKLKTVAASEQEADPIFAFDDLTRNERQLYVKDCTEVPALAVVMIAASVAMEAEEGGDRATVVLDDWLKFSVARTAVTAIKCLRARLQEAFIALVERPSEPLPERLRDSMATLTQLMALESGSAFGNGARPAAFAPGMNLCGLQGGGFNGGGRGRCRREW